MAVNLVFNSKRIIDDGNESVLVGYNSPTENEMSYTVASDLYSVENVQKAGVPLKDVSSVIPTTTVDKSYDRSNYAVNAIGDALAEQEFKDSQKPNVESNVESVEPSTNE